MKLQCSDLLQKRKQGAKVRRKIDTLLFAEDSSTLLNETCTIAGWIRSIRVQKTLFFITLNDGSCFDSIQIVGEEKELSNYENLAEKFSTGASIEVTGTIVSSPGKNQSIEMHASHITLIGECDPSTYPLQKKRHSFEFLRSIAHLRPRTNTQRAVTKIRNCLAFATHRFFQERDFYYIHSPILTSANCEGAGDLFHVYTHEDPPKSPSGEIDFEKEFFKKPAFLTVSGQLNAEIYACAMGDVYTFGPTFRAENSHTSRHLAEFWMIEPEMAFCDLQRSIQVAEEYVKFLIEAALSECPAEISFFQKYIDPGLSERLHHILHAPFVIISYTEAIEILEKAKVNFEYPVQWGSDLQSEHERYLVEQHFEKPCFVTDYPKDIKAFYMRQNKDGKTVAAMDLLFPKIGEIIGGSQREERLDLLEKRIKELNQDLSDYWWYLELRKYGTVPHAGFGLGFDRAVQFVTGMDNIRDIIPFPRYPGHIEF